MIDTDLRRELEARTAHLHLDRPVEAVLARGDRIRRRRRTAVLGGVVGVGLVAALGAVTLDPDRDPEVRPPSYADDATASADAAPTISPEAARRVCGRDVDLRRVISAATVPVATGLSGDGRATLVYHVGDDAVVCHVRAADELVEGVPEQVAEGTLLVSATNLIDWTLDPGTDVGFVHILQTRHLQRVVEGDGAVRVSAAVQRVVITAAGRRSEAIVEDGFALFWLTEELSAAEFEAATLTAYDDAGEVLAEVGLT